jgi:hypothetical protein
MIVFVVERHVAENGTGYEVGGRVILDRKTLAISQSKSCRQWSTPVFAATAHLGRNPASIN